MAVPVASPTLEGSLDEIEFGLLVEGVSRRYGYELGGFDASFLKSAIDRLVEDERLSSPLALLERMLREPALLERFLAGIAERKEALFQPPAYYAALRRKIAPHLRTYPSVRAWSMGCGTGEEVWSLAILLREELSRPFRIYATEIHDVLLEKARSAAFSRDVLVKSARNYQRSRGKLDLETYLASIDGAGLLDPALRRRAVFASHFPPTDAPFNQFHLILCRGTLRKLGLELKAKVFRLLHDSLHTFGFLSLGRDDDPEEFPLFRRYRTLDARHKIYQKTGD
jgi:chemotaxis protein methyltransferase CheR